MPNQIKAKMQVHVVEPGSLDAEGNTVAVQVTLSAVYSQDKNSENYSYSQATPNVYLSMWISNPQVLDFFEKGKQYILTFERAE